MERRQASPQPIVTASSASTKSRCSGCAVSQRRSHCCLTTCLQTGNISSCWALYTSLSCANWLFFFFFLWEVLWRLIGLSSATCSSLSATHIHTTSLSLPLPAEFKEPARPQCLFPAAALFPPSSDSPLHIAGKLELFSTLSKCPPWGFLSRHWMIWCRDLEGLCCAGWAEWNEESSQLPSHCGSGLFAEPLYILCRIPTVCFVIYCFAIIAFKHFTET